MASRAALRELRGIIGSLSEAVGIAPGSEIASAALGREGWLRLEVFTGRGFGRRRLQIALEFAVEASLSRPGLEGLFLHPFALSLSFEGVNVEEWSDSLSSFWEPHPAAKGRVTRARRTGAAESERSPRRDALEGREVSGERLEAQGRIALLDLDVPREATLELHLRLPWADRDKREGFEARSQLSHAALRVFAQGPFRRAFSAPAVEFAIVG